MVKGSIHILIQRDAKNMPFAKVLYNGKDAFNLDDDMKIFAEYLARKSSIAGKDDGLVFASTETGEVMEAEEIDRLIDLEYCISGSEAGKECAYNLISTICCGADNKDIEAPVFVTNGKGQTIFINEKSVSASYKKVDFSIMDRQESEKLRILDTFLEEPIISHSKRI